MILNRSFHPKTGQPSKGQTRSFTVDPLWEMYKVSYSDSDYDRMWDALFTACELFRTVAKDVAEHFRYPYESNDDRNMTNYLKRVRELPADANEIY
ncbi:MAG: aminoglycoside 6-adenylyltransferase [Clostridia bacterium]